MIQRIQTVYLLLAAAAAALYNFLPLGIDAAADGDMTIYGKELLPIIGLSAGIGVIALIAIFLFSNRKLQMTFCKINLFLSFVLIGVSVYLLFFQPDWQIETPGIGLALPVFMIVFHWLAMKKIDDDEQLVRSMDRLR